MIEDKVTGALSGIKVSSHLYIAAAGKASNVLRTTQIVIATQKAEGMCGVVICF